MSNAVIQYVEIPAESIMAQGTRLHEIHHVNYISTSERHMPGTIKKVVIDGQLSNGQKVSFECYVKTPDFVRALRDAVNQFLHKYPSTVALTTGGAFDPKATVEEVDGDEGDAS